MAYIKEMSYSRQASVKVAEYQYEKPTVSMVAILEEGDNYDEVFSDLKVEVNKQLKIIVKELKNA